jgi:hypothetical protein
VFTEILSIARLEGGDLLSFGGDALLLLFSGEDHRSTGRFGRLGDAGGDGRRRRPAGLDRSGVR